MSKPPPPSALRSLVLLGALACLPLAAEAQVFKCKQADGSVKFQGSPCPGSLKADEPAPAADPSLRTSGPAYDPYAKENAGQRAGLIAQPRRPMLADPSTSTTPTTTASARYQGTTDNPRPSGQGGGGTSAENQRIRWENDKTRNANERTQIENERTEANNRLVRCTNARRILSMKESGGAFSQSSSGEKRYVGDSSQQRELNEAQQRVNAECR